MHSTGVLENSAPLADYRVTEGQRLNVPSDHPELRNRAGTVEYTVGDASLIRTENDGFPVCLVRQKIAEAPSIKPV